VGRRQWVSAVFFIKMVYINRVDRSGNVCRTILPYFVFFDRWGIYRITGTPDIELLKLAVVEHCLELVVGGIYTRDKAGFFDAAAKCNNIFGALIFCDIICTA